MSKQSTAYLYLHTHWDREWYLPFEAYRLRLVDVVKTVIARLESGALPNFLLDGQASVLEDVLEIDPSLAEPLKRLMKKGTLSAGPWYVLADQLLVSGESLVRNLRLGLEVTSRYGPPAMIGYCPDTFGHTQDLPRILQGFAIDSAFVWRGTPKLDSGPAFLWQSADGSTVLAYQLSRGYYQTEPIVNANIDLNKFVAKWLPPNDIHFCRQLNGALIPVGGDHLSPPENIAKQLANLSNGSARKKSTTAAKVVSGKTATELVQAQAPCLVATPLPAFAKLINENIDRAKLPYLQSELRDNSSAQIFSVPICCRVCCPQGYILSERTVRQSIASLR